jgi:Mg2+-importing ATPase
VKAPSSHFPKKLLAAGKHQKREIRVAAVVVESAGLDVPAVYAQLATRAGGLTTAEADARLLEHGPNVLAQDRPPGLLRLLGHAVLDPLVILLGALATVSAATGDLRSAVMMLAMIALSVGLKLFQEAKASGAAAKLKAMIAVNATTLRDGAAAEIPVAHLVPGDVVQLTAGDMIPGDVRIVHAKDLFVNQGSLTGESLPTEKYDVASDPATLASTAPIALGNVAYLGSSVASGAATGVVVATGRSTYLGGMAEAITEPAPPTAFERGIKRFTWLMLRFLAVMVPLVFVINGVTKGNWTQAFFFALAVAVGLTPEMLPMIVTVCLSKGAVAMGRKKVIVKRIDAIQNLGAMNVLCTDKTGTLTMDQVILERHCDVLLRKSDRVLALAYTNSHFQTCLKSVLDRAILAHEETHEHARIPEQSKVDEIPFDFVRRIMSVVVRTPEGMDRIIAKGAPEAVFAKCSAFTLDGVLHPMDHEHIASLKKEYERLSAEGFRVLAIASKDVPPHGAIASGATAYGKDDERDLVLDGYAAFLDPPKDSAAAAITALQGHGISVKVVTGDNELVARKICKDVGLRTDVVLLGDDVEKMTDAELAGVAPAATLFARVSPAHKERIIKALQAGGHIVGFLGDGINDAPALHAADVGISVDSAVDVAKASADMILLERSLLVVDEGVLEGRKVFSNVIKYVRMGASSNFGNMFSVIGASVFVPFLPMLPLQILANNLLYDLGQTAIPSDSVDDDRIQMPRTWDIRELTHFILFIGPCSSIFDYATFLVMLYVFGCWNVATPEIAAHSQSLFQTGWFVESLITQTLIIHVIRTNKLPFVQSRSSVALLATSLLVMAVGLALPFSPLRGYLGFSALPALYWPILAAMLLGYVVLTQVVKSVLLRRGWI